jgi:hypothetical protein
MLQIQLPMRSQRSAAVAIVDRRCEIDFQSHISCSGVIFDVHKVVLFLINNAIGDCNGLVCIYQDSGGFSFIRLDCIADDYDST